MVGRVERGRCLRQGVGRSDEWAQPPVPQPVLQLGKARAIGLDDEEDRPDVVRRVGRWFRDADERTAGADQCRGATEYLTSDHIEDHVHFTDAFESVTSQIHEDLGAKAEDGLPVGGATGTYHPRARLPRKLHRYRAHTARGAVNQNGLAGLEPAVGEQSLPCRETRNRQRRCRDVVDSSDSGARLRASIATNSASVPLRHQSVTPKTRWPTVRPVVP